MAARALPEHHTFPKCRAQYRPLPFPSGERGLASASSSPLRLGNVDSSTIVPAPEERARDPAPVSPETPTLGRARGEWGSCFQVPGTGWTQDRDLGSGPSDRGRQAVGPRARTFLHNLTFETRYLQVRGALSKARYLTVQIGKQV